MSKSYLQRRRIGSNHADRRIVGRFHVLRKRIFVGLGTLDVVMQVGVLAGLFKHSSPGENKIVAGDRIAVAPFGGRPDVKSVDGFVIVCVDVVGRPGNAGERLGIECVQPFPQTIGDADVLHPGHPIQIERKDIRAIDVDEIRLRRRIIGHRVERN